MKEFENPINARAIIEVLGTPKEYIEKTLRLIVNGLENKKDLKVLKKELFEAVKKENYFTTFTELEISFKDIETLVNFCFDFMPSTIEILEPPNINISARTLTNFLNDLLAKLHKVDMAVKELSAEKKVLEENIMRLLRNNVIITLREAKKPLDIEVLSKRVGVPKEQLEPLLKKWIDEKFIKKQDSKYLL